MDDIERAELAIEQMLYASLSNPHKPVAVLSATGACLNCDEPVLDDLIFCDADCKADYDKRQFFNHLKGTAR